MGQFQLYSVLSIGHTHLPGFQRVLSLFFFSKRYRSTDRQDLVLVRPPGAGKDFRLSINTVWYCRPNIRKTPNLRLIFRLIVLFRLILRLIAEREITSLRTPSEFVDGATEHLKHFNLNCGHGFNLGL